MVCLNDQFILVILSNCRLCYQCPGGAICWQPGVRDRRERNPGSMIRDKTGATTEVIRNGNLLCAAISKGSGTHFPSNIYLFGAKNLLPLFHLSDCAACWWGVIFLQVFLPFKDFDRHKTGFIAFRIKVLSYNRCANRRRKKTRQVSET